jgi:hypothetical protein
MTHAYILENAYEFSSVYVAFIPNICAAIISVPCRNPLL